MLRNKKASGEILGAIGRLVLAGISLAVVGTILFNVFGPAFASASSKVYYDSFEEFVDDLNSVSPGPFFLEFGKKSAVIGFSNGADHWECFNCYVGPVNPRPTIIFNRPTDAAECDEGACICLCNGKFRLEGENPKVGMCEKELVCKALEDNVDIVGKTIIKKYTSGTEHWNNGFLFANDISEANGLKKYDRKITKFYVEREDNEIGICNDDMLDFNKDTLGIDSCINKDWTP